MTVVVASLLDVLSGARERSEAVQAARAPREPGALHPSKCVFPDVPALLIIGFTFITLKHFPGPLPPLI